MQFYNSESLSLLETQAPLDLDPNPEESPIELEKPKKVYRRYSLEDCIEVFKLYESDFYLRNSKNIDHRYHYLAAKRNGYYQICLAAMELNIGSTVDKQSCIDEASKHRSELWWKKRSPRTYIAASDKGWMDECLAEIAKNKKPNDWTDSALIEFGRSFKTLQDLKESPRYLYPFRLIGKRKLREAALGHMPDLRETKIKATTLESCQRLAQTCRNRTEFRQKYTWECRRAILNGWLQTIQPRSTWNEESLVAFGKSFSTLKELKASPGYVHPFRLIGKKKLREAALGHMPDVREYRIRATTLEFCIEIAKTCRNRNQFIQNYRWEHERARLNGWLPECLSYIGGKRTDEKDETTQKEITFDLSINEVPDTYEETPHCKELVYDYNA